MKFSKCLRGMHTPTYPLKKSTGYEYIWVLGCVNIKGHWHLYKMIFDDYDGQ